MSLSHAFTIVKTIGFANEINPDLQAKLMELAFHTFKKPTDMVVFRPISNPPQPHETETAQYEDERRTAIFHVRGLSKKVYAKVDDYGEPAKWDEIYDKEVAEDLKKSGIARFVMTFMLAEDY